MRSKSTDVSLLLISLITVLLTADLTWAQEDSTPKKRLHSPVTVRGLVGGEAHDSYVIRARKGQTMTVQISWRRREKNRAEFTVSQSPNFFNSTPVDFGKLSDEGRRWRGKIPGTGDYYLYVVAHPTAQYILRVTVK